jgi:hypothetical protein
VFPFNERDFRRKVQHLGESIEIWIKIMLKIIMFAQTPLDMKNINIDCWIYDSRLIVGQENRCF